MGISYDRKIGGLEHFQIMVDMLGRDEVCKFLDIHRTTLERILKGKSKLPRPYLIALYWETPWGRSVVDTHNHYMHYLNRQQIETLEGVIAKLEESIQTLVTEANHMSANTPVYRINSRHQG